MTAPEVAEPRSTRSARTAASTSVTTTAARASPRAASTADSQPVSMRTKSSSVPSTPSLSGETLGPGPGVGGVEGELQSLDTGAEVGQLFGVLGDSGATQR